MATREASVGELRVRGQTWNIAISGLDFLPRAPLWDWLMARPPRIDRVNGIYHVTSRGNGRPEVFLSAADRERFVTRLGDNLESYDVVLYAYVPMDNHFHLRVRTPRATLSRYIHLNPVRVAARRRLPLGRRLRVLRERRWSSYRAYAYASGGDAAIGKIRAKLRGKSVARRLGRVVEKLSKESQSAIFQV